MAFEDEQVTVELNGKSYELVLDLAAMIRAEKEFGGEVLSQAMASRDGEFVGVNFSAIVTLIWSGLQRKNQRMPKPKVMAMMNMRDMPDYINAIVDALIQSGYIDKTALETGEPSGEPSGEATAGE